MFGHTQLIYICLLAFVLANAVFKDTISLELYACGFIQPQCNPDKAGIFSFIKIDGGYDVTVTNADGRDRGHRVVVINEITGELLDSVAYDTYTCCDAILASYLNSIPSNDRIVVIVAGDSAHQAPNTYSIIESWGCPDAALAYREPFIFIGTPNANIPSWQTCQKSAASGNPIHGTFVVDLTMMHPTMEPTQNPTLEPTQNPTFKPTDDPTLKPTQNPTLKPTSSPTKSPTLEPTQNPTFNPTNNPSTDPTLNPTGSPTLNPSSDPSQPTTNPTSDPSKNPTNDPTAEPTCDPMLSSHPSNVPIIPATLDPASDPNHAPSTFLIAHPSTTPSDPPTKTTTTASTNSPSFVPTIDPTTAPTNDPSFMPSSAPTSSPTVRYNDNSVTNVPTQPPTHQKQLDFICFYDDDKESSLIYLSLSDYAATMMDAILYSVPFLLLQPIEYGEMEYTPFTKWKRAGIFDFIICNIFDNELRNSDIECPSFSDLHKGHNNNNKYTAIGTFGIAADEAINSYQEKLIAVMTSNDFIKEFNQNMNRRLNNILTNNRRLLEYDNFRVVKMVIIDPLNTTATSEEGDQDELTNGANNDSVTTTILIIIIVFLLVLLSIFAMVIYFKKYKQRNNVKEVEGGRNDANIEMNELEGNQGIHGELTRNDVNEEVDDEEIEQIQNLNEHSFNNNGHGNEDNESEQDMIKSINETAIGYDYNDRNQVINNNHVDEQDVMNVIDKTHTDKDDIDDKIIEMVNETIIDHKKI